MADEKTGQPDPDQHKAGEAADPPKENTKAEKPAVTEEPAKPTKVASAAPSVRTDASGRVLHPWEVSPKKRD